MENFVKLYAISQAQRLGTLSHSHVERDEQFACVEGVAIASTKKGSFAVSAFFCQFRGLTFEY